MEGLLVEREVSEMEEITKCYEELIVETDRASREINKKALAFYEAAFTLFKRLEKEQKFGDRMIDKVNREL